MLNHITKEEAWEMFDKAAQKEYGMSGEEFWRRYKAGEWKGQHGRIMRVVMLYPGPLE
jgi:hypothetical protein